ncbi:MAG TPA: biotin--[acetyl-CoA-carboxylase] ligase [Salinivirgaceae bacterium]|nr:biotin--[acetyl-CoA-carboxylase] ligase [Salinivirgaceae bacterium]
MEIRKNNILWFDKVDSTNSEIKRMGDLPNGFCLATHFQENGRGQMGNRWESEYGKNILASYFFKVNIPVEQSFLVSMATALSIAQFLESYTENVQIKWPNDILLNKKKVAGILIENEIQGETIVKSILGIGININQKQFENLPDATSLSIETNQDYEPESLVIELQRFLMVHFSTLTQQIDSLKTSYMQRLFNREKGSYISNKETFEAAIFDVGFDGKLTLLLNDKSFRSFYFKEVTIPLR